MTTRPLRRPQNRIAARVSATCCSGENVPLAERSAPTLAIAASQPAVFVGAAVDEKPVRSTDGEHAGQQDGNDERRGPRPCAMPSGHLFSMSKTDPKTGVRKRRQKWVTFRGTKKDARTQLTELLRSANRDEFVERSKVTLGEWLKDWLDKAIKPPARRINTYRTYKRVIEDKLLPALGDVRLQDLKAMDLKRYYTEQQATLSSRRSRSTTRSSTLR